MKKGPAIALALMLAAAASCALFFFSGQHRVISAKAALARSMKDPDAVQFREIRYQARTKTVCGMFNAKNSYGAYIGFNAFTYDQADHITVMPDEPKTPGILGNTAGMSRARVDALITEHTEAIRKMISFKAALERFAERCSG